MRAARIAPLTALLLLAMPAAAEDKPTARVIREVTECRDLTDGAARLACFDAKVAALAKATDERTIVILDREEVKKTRRSLFGFPLPRLPFFGNDKDDAGSKEPEAEAIRQLDTTITSVAPYGYGLWTFVLAEGGTWRTIETERGFSPRAGAKIMIKRGLIGNYMASIGHATVRVERVR